MITLATIFFILIVLAGAFCYLYITWSVLSEMDLPVCNECPLQDECSRAMMLGGTRLCDNVKPIKNK